MSTRVFRKRYVCPPAVAVSGRPMVPEVTESWASAGPGPQAVNSSEPKVNPVAKTSVENGVRIMAYLLGNALVVRSVRRRRCRRTQLRKTGSDVTAQMSDRDAAY